MTDLLNIAKECGADLIETRTTKECAAVIMSISELHATVEKVCGPLVEALSANPVIHDTERMAYEAIKEYRKLMGQDK